jgi:hypothetical protein
MDSTIQGIGKTVNAISSITARTDYPDIIRVTSEDGANIDWLLTENNTMEAGYVCILPYQPGFSVHLFISYQLGILPRLLRIEDNRGPETKDLRNAVPPQATFTPSVVA